MLKQPKFEGVATFRNVNHEGVDTVLFTVAHSKCPVKNATTGLTHEKLKDIAAVFRNQLGGRIQNFEVFGLLQDC